MSNYQRSGVLAVGRVAKSAFDAPRQLFLRGTEILTLSHLFWPSNISFQSPNIVSHGLAWERVERTISQPTQATC